MLQAFFLLSVVNWLMRLQEAHKISPRVLCGLRASFFFEHMIFSAIKVSSSIHIKESRGWEAVFLLRPSPVDASNLKKRGAW